MGKWLAITILPLAYTSYMWLVHHTSKTTLIGISDLWEMTARGDNVFIAVWHQDAFIGSFCLRDHGVVSMVSHSSLGNILTKIFERYNFIPIRGGSSRGGKEALANIIEYMNTHKGVPCGMAVDGSRGPAREVQIGTLLMAKATGAAIYPMRGWAKWKLFAPTWDKMLIPLPFNHMVFMLGNPMRVPPDADREALDELRAELKVRLNDLTKRTESFFQKRTEKRDVSQTETRKE